MKKLSTLLLVFLIGIGMSHAEKNNRFYNGYSNSFIFVEGGIEFAIFPDGQFDFNYLDAGPNFQGFVGNNAVNISFNTGFNYDHFVQYDTFGAVIQIENTPIFYDGFGRIIQAGNVFINYHNGWVNRVGNLHVFYNSPGMIFRTSGFINRFNRFYVVRPWHRFYDAPLFDRCIVWNNPYRLHYNPFRFGWNYHRLHWNRPNYWNGRFTRSRGFRNFHRPGDRVNFRNFERGTRNNRGRAIATREARQDREAINRGRRTISRNNNSSTRNNTMTTNRLDRDTRNNRNDRAVVNRNSRNGEARLSNSISTRENDRTIHTRNNRRGEMSRFSRNSSSRISTPTNTRSNSVAISNRSSRNTTPSVSTNRHSRSSSNSLSRSSSSRRTNTAISGRSSRSSNNTMSRSSNSRSSRSVSTNRGSRSSRR